MMHSNAAKVGESIPDSRDNAEIQELLDLLSTEDLHNFSLSGMQRLQSSSNSAMRQVAKLLTQGHLTIFDVERLIRGRS